MGLFATSVWMNHCNLSEERLKDFPACIKKGDWTGCIEDGFDATDLGNMMLDFTNQTDEYAILCMCIDSDYAHVFLYQHGEQIDRFTIGEPYTEEEFASPNFEIWKQFENGTTTLQAFLEANTEFVFVEEILAKTEDVFGFPLLDVSLLP